MFESLLALFWFAGLIEFGLRPTKSHDPPPHPSAPPVVSDSETETSISEMEVQMDEKNQGHDSGEHISIQESPHAGSRGSVNPDKYIDTQTDMVDVSDGFVSSLSREHPKQASSSDTTGARPEQSCSLDMTEPLDTMTSTAPAQASVSRTSSTVKVGPVEVGVKANDSTSKVKTVKTKSEAAPPKAPPSTPTTTSSTGRTPRQSSKPTHQLLPRVGTSASLFDPSTIWVGEGHDAIAIVRRTDQQVGSGNWLFILHCSTV